MLHTYIYIKFPSSAATRNTFESELSLLEGKILF